MKKKVQHEYQVGRHVFIRLWEGMGVKTEYKCRIEECTALRGIPAYSVHVLIDGSRRHNILGSRMRPVHQYPNGYPTTKEV